MIGSGFSGIQKNFIFGKITATLYPCVVAAIEGTRIEKVDLNIEDDLNDVGKCFFGKYVVFAHVASLLIDRVSQENRSKVQDAVELAAFACAPLVKAGHIEAGLFSEGCAFGIMSVMCTVNRRLFLNVVFVGVLANAVLEEYGARYPTS